MEMELQEGKLRLMSDKHLQSLQFGKDANKNYC